MSARRSSCRILPGASPVSRSTAVPWCAASTRSVPSAMSVPSGSSIRAAHRLSRPNSVRYHGTPGAEEGVAGAGGQPQTQRLEVVEGTFGQPRDPAVVGGHRRTRPLHRRRRLADQGGRVGDPQLPGHGDRGAAARPSRANAACRRASTVASGAVTVTDSPSTDQVRPERTTPDGAAARPALTGEIGARSASTTSDTSVDTASAAVEVTVMVSSSPAGTSRRWRVTRTVGSGPGSPSQRASPTKAVAPGPSGEFATDSTDRPSSSSSARLKTRTSAWNIPCTPTARI